MPNINFNVTIRAGFVDLEGFQAVLEALGENASDFKVELFGKGPEQLQADPTPPFGISREDINNAISVHVSALVAWTIENVTSGPLMDVPRVILRTAYRRLIEDGDDATLAQLDLDDVQIACIRSVFKDAQNGMVPL